MPSRENKTKRHGFLNIKFLFIIIGFYFSFLLVFQNLANMYIVIFKYFIINQNIF